MPEDPAHASIGAKTPPRKIEKAAADRSQVLESLLLRATLHHLIIVRRMQDFEEARQVSPFLRRRVKSSRDARNWSTPAPRKGAPLLCRVFLDA